MKLSTILIILFCFETTNAQTGQNARDLRVKLFDTDGYDKRVRPAFDQTVATDIHVSFFVTSLNDIDMAKETMVCTGYFRIEWTDDYLKWTPASFGGLEYSHWPQDDIWKPDITVKNSVKDYKELGDKALRVAVAYDGSVTWSPFQVTANIMLFSRTYYKLSFFYIEYVIELIAYWYYRFNHSRWHGSLLGVVLKWEDIG